MTVAVVEAMPLVVKIALYGAAAAGEPFDELGADGDRQLRPGHLGTAEAEAVVAVGGGEVHQLVGQLVVVLQSVHQGDRLQALLQGGGEGEPQELGVAGGQGVVVGGAVDEVVGEVRPALRRSL